MFYSMLGASKIGTSEVILILVVSLLVATLISIFCITYAKKKKEAGKAVEAKPKKEEKPVEASQVDDYVGVARTININKILGKSKEEKEEYFEKILSAKTTNEVNKINEDKTLKDMVKPEETEKLDEFVLFTEESLYDNTPAPKKIEVGKKHIDNK